MNLIYKVTNKINNKVYIGQTTTSLEQRRKEHEYAIFHKNYYFYNAIKKYGKENFLWEVIEDNLTFEELNDRERYWINYYLSNNSNFGYNMTPGGDNNDALSEWRLQHPEQAKVAARLGYQKMREILARCPEKEQQRKEKAKDGVQNYARAHQKEKQELGKQIYLTHKEQQDLQMKKFHKEQSKPVKCLETGKVYPSASEASHQTHISQGNISSCCTGKRLSAGKNKNGEKLHWIYLDKQNLTQEEQEELYKYE